MRHILGLDSRGFAPRLAAVKNMADSLLAAHHCDPVDINGPESLGKHMPELSVKLNQKYD